MVRRLLSRRRGPVALLACVVVLPGCHHGDEPAAARPKAVPLSSPGFPPSPAQARTGPAGLTPSSSRSGTCS